MRTIGRRYPGRRADGDYEVECAYCGVPWYRKKMIRDASGFLACPDDQRGRDQVTLDRLNAANATAVARQVRRRAADW